MAIDGIILNKEVEILKSRLPIRINRISQISSDDILLNVHANKNRSNLIISTHSLYNRIHFTNMNYTNNNEPTSFVMVLRKYINNGIIEKIEQPNFDRYLILYIRSLNDLYDTKFYRLHIELMGKYANVILVDEDNRIIDALKRIPPFENNKRTIWPGAIFTYPDNQNKLNPFNIDKIDPDRSLVEQLMGFSPLLQKEFYYRFNNLETYNDIINEIKNSQKLYITTLDDSYQYHIIPLEHLNNKITAYEIEEGFDRLYYDLEEKTRIKEITGDLFKFVSRQIKHYQNKLNKLYDSLENAKNADVLKEYGDLLFTYTDLNKKGLESIDLKDYYDNEITIKLDPKLNVKDNANRYYNNYQKKKRSLKYLNEQIDITNNELDYFNSLNEQLQIANFYDAQMIEEELIKYNYLKAKRQKAKKKKDKLHLYQLEFNGHLITFGKNNSQNEFLTFKYAKNNYMWFHAQKFHGAHLCVDCDNPDEETIRMCANLAAYFSTGRKSSSVPVDYCLIKNIKKIKGSKAGLVSINNYKTIFIDPYEVELDIKLI